MENPQLVAWSESVAELLDLDPKELVISFFAQFAELPILKGCISKYLDVIKKVFAPDT